MKRMTMMAAMALGLIGPAHAADVAFINGWRIVRNDPNFGSGCAMVAQFSSIGVSLGFFRSPSLEDMTGVFVAGQSWRSLVEGQSYPVEITIGRTSVTGTAIVKPYAGAMGLRFRIPQQDYFRIFDSTTGSFSISSAGKKLITYAAEEKDIYAVSETSRCVKGLSDPFASK